jgi:hypothetical protein
MTLKTLGMGISKVVTKKATEKLKKYLEKKKGKDLDWDDVKASYKTFTKKK